MLLEYSQSKISRKIRTFSLAQKNKTLIKKKSVGNQTLAILNLVD